MENVSSDNDVSGVADERIGTKYHFRHGLRNYNLISLRPSVLRKEDE